ncbi:hypothetical protein C4802_14895, partial [Salmonella enterica subsp. enterica serovar Rubislaw]
MGAAVFGVLAGYGAGGAESCSVYPDCRGRDHALLPPGLYGQRWRLYTADEPAPLAGADFCRQSLQARR